MIETFTTETKSSPTEFDRVATQTVEQNLGGYAVGGQVEGGSFPRFSGPSPQEAARQEAQQQVGDTMPYVEPGFGQFQDLSQQERAALVA